MTRLAIVFSVFAVSLVACSTPREPDRRVLLDLAAEARYADTLVEPRALIFGTPEARRVLSGGWSTRDEIDGHGRFVWAVGGSSRLELSILDPRPLQLRLEVRSFHFEGAPPQTVRVELGEVELGRAQVSPTPKVIELDIPAQHQKSGPNALALHWGWNQSPKEAVGAQDRRPLAAAVYRLELLDPDHPARESVDVRADGERLWIPGGGRIDYFLEVPADTVLSVEDLRIRGSAQIFAEVKSALAPDGQPGRRPLTAGDSPLPEGLLRLRLEAFGDGGAIVHRPRLLGPPQGSTEAAPDAAAAATPPTGETSKETPPSIVIYSIDTLRADVLEVYGGPVPTPTMARFAEAATVFEQAVAQSSWTKASMASVLTGLSPPAHGALSRRHVLAPERVTLQELLSAAGYQTAAFNTNPNLTRTFGFDQGFDVFVDFPETATAEEVHARVLTWLEEGRDPERPLFLWVHTLDPHSPYSPPAEARDRWAADVDPSVAADTMRWLDDMRAGRTPRNEAVLDDLRALYYAEAAYSDEVFGEFLGTLDRHGLGGAPLLLLSDHGEEFYEHGNLEHGRSLFEESVRVPMIVRAPGRLPAGRVTARVQHLDVMPTLLGWAGVEVPATLEGQPLGQLARVERAPGADRRRGRWVFSHLHLDGAERAALYRTPLKLTAERIGGDRLGRFQLFDLSTDPGELNNLVDSMPLERGWLVQEMRRRLEVREDAAEVDLDPETRRRLEALGYL
ncbi:MAG: sulfatase [Acidobacteriota bacterium]